MRAHLIKLPKEIKPYGLITVKKAVGIPLNDEKFGMLYGKHINIVKDQNTTGGSNNELL